MASQTDVAFSVQLSQFLAKNTNPEDRQALTAFLEACPAYSKPTSYVSDIEQRLQLLREIQQGYKKHDFELEITAALWSALMIVPLERLRSLRDSGLNSFLILRAVLSDILSHIPMLLKVFLAKNPSEEDGIVLLAFEAKRKESSFMAESQLLAYLATIRQLRIQANKKNVTTQGFFSSR